LIAVKTRNESVQIRNERRGIRSPVDSVLKAKKADGEQREGGRPKQKRKPNRTRSNKEGQPGTQNQASGDKPTKPNRGQKGKSGGKPSGDSPKPESPS